MVQLEVAERVVAKPGGSEYGLLSATAAMYTRAELLFTLPPSAFSPPPKVDSSVVRLVIEPKFGALGVDEQSFLKFLRHVFAHKRKTLTNNLRSAGYAPSEIADAMGDNKIDLLVRAETVSVQQTAQIFRSLLRKRAAAH
jgi:16S rRNA (adenine1518-N6/adenine1519-N6)-dimethyltransferase